MIKQTLALVGLSLSLSVNSAVISLDADSAITGSLLETTPLVTSFGTISYTGSIELESSGYVDGDMQNAGSSGANFSGTSGNFASFLFDFDVTSISFLYGGNGGDFEMFMLDGSGNVINSFYQASTSGSEPAGPMILMAQGTREIKWRDTVSWAAIDNVNLDVTSVPVPAAAWLFGSALIGLAGIKRNK